MLVNRGWIDQLTRRWRGVSPPKFVFVVHTRNHVRILAPVATQLIQRAIACEFVDVEAETWDNGATSEIARYGLVSIPLARCAQLLKPNDVLVLANDWWPEQVIALVEDCRRKKTRVIGVVEGCRFAQPFRYRKVDKVLVWGASGLVAFDRPAEIVGAPMIESCLRVSPTFDDPAYAVINYKFTFNMQRGRESWIRDAIAACNAAALRFRISRHPNDRGDTLDLPLEPRNIEELMLGASALISRPSTTIYQALAAGVPVVHFPAENEDVVEFADPLGAFESASAADELPELLRRATAQRTTVRERSRLFLERHVSIDLARPATQRIVDALLTEYARHSRS
jgi:hypothetical protein